MDIFNISIEGASHQVSGLPCQDYSRTERLEKNVGSDANPRMKKGAVAVVCDGHGSEKYFRSQVGSMLASAAAVEQLSAFFEAYPSYLDLTASGRVDEKMNWLKLSVLTGWQLKVEAWTKGEYEEISVDKNRPPMPRGAFTEEELKKASGTLLFRQNFDIGHPYGTTMIAALLCEDYYLVMMIGDGAAVLFLPNGQGEAVQFAGKNMFDDAPHSLTDSLCNSDAYNRIYCAVCPYEGDIGLGLCTDGLSEVVKNDNVLIERYIIYANFLAESSATPAEKAEAEGEIESQLKYVSLSSAVKDDISVAIAATNFKVFAPPAAEDAPAADAPAEDAPAADTPAEDAPTNGEQAE